MAQAQGQVVQARQGVLKGTRKSQLQSKAVLPFDRTRHVTNCLEGTSLPQCTTPLSPVCLIFSGTLGFHLIYFALPSQPLPLLTDRKRSSHPGFCCSRNSGSTKRQHSAPGQLEVRTLRDRAAGPSSFYTSILHLPITLRSPWLPAQVPQLPTLPAHTAHVRTRVPWALLTAGIEHTFLDFEIVL